MSNVFRSRAVRMTLATAAFSAMGISALSADLFEYSGSIVSYTVPATGTYRIVAYGAAGGLGGFSPSGTGAVIGGDLSLSGGTLLAILVGGRGESGIAGGGGGGSFVVLSASNTPLVIAGGGGGGTPGENWGIGDGRIEQSGGNSASFSGGDNGLGGSADPEVWDFGGGGGGFLGDGIGSISGGRSFLNGGAGGAGYSGGQGGFGGGGGGGYYPGGGGGYSGGAGQAGAGGGGSFLDPLATNAVLIAGGSPFDDGMGRIDINFVPEPSALATLVVGLLVAARRRV